MRYKVEFEFDTDDQINGSPGDWHWQNLLESVEDDHTVIDIRTIRVYKQAGWELA